MRTSFSDGVILKRNLQVDYLLFFKLVLHQVATF